MTYRVEVTEDDGSQELICKGLDRDEAIYIAADMHDRGARVWNEKTGQELVNGSDGRIKEID